MTIQYIRFNKNDKILGLHKAHVDALTKSHTNFNESYIDILEHDISSLGDIDELKKGTVLIGIWSFCEAIRLDAYFNRLMVSYLNKEYVKSEETVKELADKGLKNHESLIRDLSLYDMSFDVWLEKYKVSGQVLKDEGDIEKLEQAEKLSLMKADLKKADEHFAGACFSLPAIAGKMGGNLYFTVQIPYNQAVQLLKINQNELPVHLRAQRQLNEKRAIAIADYMEERFDDYTLPALTACVSESMKFEPVKGFTNLGMVQIPMGSIIHTIDGQHRSRAIQIVLERQPLKFKEQSISVIFFYDQGLQKSQQAFSDINNNMIKPPKALNILFDHSNKMNNLVIESIEQAGIKQAVEFEKASPGAKSSKVWSISALKKAIETVTGLNEKKAKLLDDDEFNDYKNLAVNWLLALIEYTQGDLKGAVFHGTGFMLAEMRTELISTHAAYLHSVALASVHMTKEFKDYQVDGYVRSVKGDCPVPTFYDLKCLADISVMKTADIWQERIVRKDFTMNPTANGIKLGAHVILERMGAFIPLSIVEINDLVFANAA
jgi:DNA sulfur modification protein DndB